MHRDVATEPELQLYLDRWLSRTRDMSKYRIGYLAFHGARGSLKLSPGVEITLSDLAEMLQGKCKGRLLYFGSCSTLAVLDEVLHEFCRKTGADGIVGYTKDVYFTDSVALDLIMLTDLVSAQRLKPAYERLRRDHPMLTMNLGLRMATKTWASNRLIAVQAVNGAVSGVVDAAPT